mmetsp:Transcript_8242/g.15125  ORF Transcript_8242/g.15125 Transcript_8242/m.15125 type:complete len:252 (-) Transcript_8242:14-769(-)
MVLRLRELRHLVQRHVVRVEEQNEVVQLLVRRKAHGLLGHPLLEAAVAAQHVHVVVEQSVLRSVEPRGSHLLGSGQPHGVGDARAQGARGGLDARGTVLRVGELGVARGGGVPLAEVGHLVLGDVVACHVEPRVQEHGPVPCREHEAVAVHPRGVRRVVRHGLAPQHRADLGRAQREPEVPGLGSGDGVHGKPAGLVGSRGEGLLNGRGSGHGRHLQRAASHPRGNWGEAIDPEGESKHESANVLHPSFLL